MRVHLFTHLSLPEVSATGWSMLALSTFRPIIYTVLDRLEQLG